jgi:hypothetical protein
VARTGGKAPADPEILFAGISPALAGEALNLVVQVLLELALCGLAAFGVVVVLRFERPPMGSARRGHVHDGADSGLISSG